MMRTKLLWSWVVLAAILDVTLLLGGAYILWNNGGPTVVSGRAGGLAIFVIFVSAILVLRLVVRRMHLRRAGAQAAVGLERVILVVDLSLVFGSWAIWLVGEHYVAGWVAFLAAMFLILGGLWQLFDALFRASSNRPGHAAATVPARERSVMAVVEIAAGGVGVLLTSAVHSWSAMIFSGLVILVGGSLIISTLANTWARSTMGGATAGTVRRA